MIHEMTVLMDRIESAYPKYPSSIEFVVSVSYGSKYAKIVANNSVWGFVVITDTDKKFPKWSILKAAGWNAPARNFARGNLLELNKMTVRWTGA